jgi:putative ABC transport system substrate-binding protein
MNRREFIAGLGSAVAWPLLAWAQQPAMPVIGFLSTASANTTISLKPFLQGLKEGGFVEGQNVNVEFRWAEGQYERLPLLAADLVRSRVAVIFASAVPAAHAAKAATSSIPINIGGNPVKEGLVTRLNRPEGNLTGVTQFYGEVGTQRLELLRELVPKATVIAVLVNPSNPNFEFRLSDVQDAARAIRQQIQVFNASSESDLDSVFISITQSSASALLIGDDPFFTDRRRQIVALAARYAVPTIYYQRIFVEAGGLIGYSAIESDLSRQAGVYTGRILKGQKPADLPVMQATRFELVINLKTAKALGLTVPANLLALADEVIE